MPRLRALTLLPALLLLATAACAADEPAPSGSETGAAGDPAFPATVETAFGEVVVEERPERVVALGWGDAETALALGVQPVGASDWLEFGGDGVGPWAEGLYEQSPTIIDTLEPSYEEIAGLAPDLILDVKSSGDPARHERLSSIAPTVAVPEGGESYLTSREQQVEMIAAAVGEPERGEEILAEMDAAFDAAAEAHPEWEGRTITAATRTAQEWGAYVEGSERVGFLQRLGFELSPTIAELPTGVTGFSVDISDEQVDLLDADLVVAFPIYVDAEEITGNRLWQLLPAVQDDRAIVLEPELASAYSLGTTLATQYAIEQLVPLLEEASRP